jgi:hypothetical protein
VLSRTTIDFRLKAISYGPLKVLFGLSPDLSEGSPQSTTPLEVVGVQSQALRQLAKVLYCLLPFAVAPDIPQTQFMDADVWRIRFRFFYFASEVSGFLRKSA